jgi:hypothetical protein
MFLKKLRAFTILLRGPHPEINLPNDGCPNSWDRWFVAGGVLKRNVKVAIRFNFESNDAARESEPLILNPGAL